jgi:tetratricopeptide (TPR) repeat protein
MFNTPENKIINENIHDSTINNVINQIIFGSFDYKKLSGDLESKKRLLADIPNEKTESRLFVSEEVNRLEKEIEALKQTVGTLYETFNKLEINSERLKLAKAFFDKGEFGEARALLNDDEEEIQSEEERLWANRDSYQKNIEPKLKEKAEERLIQALLNQSNYANPNWFADTCQNFERSINSDTNKINVFEYAVFLQKHNEFTKAEKYYSQSIENFAFQLSQKERASILNNLALLHKNQNKYEKALEEHEESLRIYRILEEANPNTYLFDIAANLNNLANLHRDQNKYEEAIKECEEALQIRRNLAEANPDTYLSYVASTLSNLGVLYMEQKNYEEALKQGTEALKIRRALAESNPTTHLSDVATTLNNLAILYKKQNKYEEAVKECEEALKIRRTLAKVNPNIYLPEVAITMCNLANVYKKQNKYKEALKKYREALKISIKLANSNTRTYQIEVAAIKYNLAIFYLESLPNREKSIMYAIETIIILLKIADIIIYTQQYLGSALNILYMWNLSEEEIQRLIDEKMKEAGENQA